MYKSFVSLLITGLFIIGCNQQASRTQAAGSADWPADKFRMVKEGLNYPWEILWGKDNHIWMTERGGKISKIDPVTGNTVFSFVVDDVVSNNEGGMLGMVQDPKFLENGYLYVVCDYMKGNSYLEKLVKMKFADGKLTPVKTIIEGIPAAVIHNGSRLLISDEATPHLFMTTGDASVSANAQSLSSLSGKMLRFNLDGSIPADNPIAGSPIWSYGHRNAQGLVMVNGTMYASEHGPEIEDEINIVEKNRNYGWPNVKGPCDLPAEKEFCATNNIKEPIWSSGDGTIAVCGLDYYSNKQIPEWQNCLLMVMLKDQTLRALHLSADGKTIDNQQVFFKNKFGRLRDLCVSPDGKVYLCTSNGSNRDVLVEVTKP